MGTAKNADRLARSIPAGLSFESRLDFLAALEASQRPEVADHAIAVARTAVALSSAVGMSDIEIDGVGYAARWHDLGKLAVDDRILRKAGRLTSEEFSEIAAHASSGVRLLGPDAPRLLLDCAGYHHERYDGFGYVGLKGEDIPFVARIVAIADVHDALLSKRDYKAPMSEENALCLMSQGVESPGFGRRSFDPFLLRRFVALRLADRDFSASRDGRAALEAFAASDPMSDLDPSIDNHDGWVIKRSGYRLRYASDEGGCRRLVEMVDPAGHPTPHRNERIREMDHLPSMC